MTQATDTTPTPPAGDAGQVPPVPGSEGSPPAPAAPAPPQAAAVPATPTAPENYQPFTVGEGQTLDESLQAMAVPVFKKLNLTQEAAQELVGVYAQIAQQLDARSNEAHATMVADWKSQGQSDKEFGGANYAKTIEDAQGLIARYGDAEFKQFLEQTGVGNHPGLLRMLARVGKHFSESTVIPPNPGAGGGRKDLADLLWGNSGAR